MTSCNRSQTGQAVLKHVADQMPPTTPPIPPELPAPGPDEVLPPPKLPPPHEQPPPLN